MARNFKLQSLYNIDEDKIREQLIKMIKEGYLPIQPMSREMKVSGATLTAFLCKTRELDYKTLSRIENWVLTREKKDKNAKGG